MLTVAKELVIEEALEMRTLVIGVGVPLGLGLPSVAVSKVEIVKGFAFDPVGL